MEASPRLAGGNCCVWVKITTATGVCACVSVNAGGCGGGVVSALSALAGSDPG